jgi:hypothetical protein
MRTVEDAVKLKEPWTGSPAGRGSWRVSIGIKLVELFYNAGIEVCLAEMANRLFP